MPDIAGSATVVTPAVLRDWPLPHGADNKNSRGRALVVGGSVPNPGGALLAARAAMRAGAGKVQLVVPEPVAVALAVAMPESLVRGAPHSPQGDLTPAAAAAVETCAEKVDAALVGPGMLDARGAPALVEAIADHLPEIVVLDALALAWLTEDLSRGGRFGSLVLSPNLNELALTLGEDPDEVEDTPAAAVLRLAEKTGAVVTSGSSSTWIGTPDGRLWRTDEGNAGLGVSGSGDVKSGTILGLCARGADPAQATVWASYLHGTVGGRLASRYGATGYLASELPGEIPQALLELRG
ncbi:NAD(P)H-hydrate dehydratase [Propioniciclava soli]|uniref:ADP-dependent (S)-NAD(P)H-hydrate dehydratase n=1 Tax=Propioniciclava soli TaxID=2775081 RepID=A0ABZ3C9S9_9ACTN